MPPMRPKEGAHHGPGDHATIRDWSDSLSAPKMPRISFSEPPDDLDGLLCDLDNLALPPMDPVAKPSTQRYSLHFLMTEKAVLPPVQEWHPRTSPDGRITLSSMRDRPLHAPLQPGTPTRAQAIMNLQIGDQGVNRFTAAFLQRTGLNIPPECDPDIPSRRESNLSQSDLEEDYDDWPTYTHLHERTGSGPAKLPTLDEERLTKALQDIAESSREGSLRGGSEAGDKESAQQGALSCTCVILAYLLARKK